jgi:flagellar hook-associated protein 3 FlgL
MLAAADDPSAAAQAARLDEARLRAAQHVRNQDESRGALSLAEAALAEASAALEQFRTLLVQAGSPTLSDPDRRSLALELRAQYERLLAAANTRDASGQYLFAGDQGGSQPFVPNAAGATYAGDEGARRLEVAEGWSLAISIPGASLFDRVADGNGRFAVSAAPANTGTAVHDGGAVADASALTGHHYRIQVSAGSPAPTCDVLDLTAGTTVLSGAACGAGLAVSFDGIAVALSGTPAAGDRFDVTPSTARSAFDTLTGLIGLVEAPIGGAAGRASLANGLATGLASVDRAIDSVLAGRARAGSSLGALEGLAAQVSAARDGHEARLAELTGLDYAEAASRFAAQQTALEAAQRSYLRVTGLSLFQFL